MSYPSCDAGEMKSDEAIESLDSATVELKRSLLEWEGIASQILELLHNQLHCEPAANWRPHCDQIVGAVQRYRDRCRCELEQIGLWREDELEVDEVHELMWDEGDRLAKWLQQMMI